MLAGASRKGEIEWGEALMARPLKKNFFATLGVREAIRNVLAAVTSKGGRKKSPIIRVLISK